MKKSEIEVGKVYTDSNGWKRKVLKIKYDSWFRNDLAVTLLNINHCNKGLHIISLKSFARWAKAEVKEGKE